MSKQIKVIGISACATGVAHTYMAQDKLQTIGKQLGHEVKIETHGSQGVRNELTQAEIDAADYVIIASDIGVDTSRFIGKKVLFSTPAKAIKDPENLFLQMENAPLFLSNKKTKTKNSGPKQKGQIRHLMNGVSFMIPFVVFGGICIALSLAITKAVYGPEADPIEGSFLYVLSNLGNFALSYMMLPILAAYTAISIGGRAAILPAIVAMMAGNGPAVFGLQDLIWDWNGIIEIPERATIGFIGAIGIGYGVGYLVKWMNSWKVHKNLLPVMPIFIIPLIGTLIPSLIVVYIIGAPIALMMSELESGLIAWQDSAAGISFVISFGIVAGILQGVDFGGPFGKVLFAFSVGMIGTNPEFMGAQAIAIPVAPLGMALTVGMFRLLRIKHFDTKEDEQLAIAAGIMGMIGISEGAIPFAIKDPFRVITASIVGAIVASIWGFAFNIMDVAAHGGPIVAFLGALDFKAGIENGKAVGEGQVVLAGLVGISGMILGAVTMALTNLALIKFVKGEKIKNLWNKMKVKKVKKTMAHQ